jgi:primosomal protein N' (replication factor Y) (superfamily II helicase)
VCQGKKKATAQDVNNTPLSQWTHIEVSVALPVHGTFTYAVPEPLLPFIMIGKRVLVPFKQRHVTGYIMGPSTPMSCKKIKNILDVIDGTPLFSAAMAGFYKWIAEYYIHPVGEVVRTALPRGLNLYETNRYSLTPEGKRALYGDGLSPLEALVLNRLTSGTYSRNEIVRHLDQDVSHSFFQMAVKCGLVTVKKELVGGRTRQRFIRYVSLADEMSGELHMTAPRRQLIETLSSAGEVAIKDLAVRIPNAAAIISGLAKAGAVKITQKPVYRDPFGDPIEPDTPPEPTPEQAHAVSVVLESLGKGFFAFLLFGVTGSGKTEVYLKVAAAAIERGVSVLVLVPEIALISQTERQFRARFGEVVALLHSGLSAGERYDQWRRIAENKVRIVVGTRSAIFSPFHDLGLIIVDEEHDSSYKQETNLRYNARDLAVMRAKELNAVVLLGSATPSIQSFFNVSAGKFTLLSIPKRVAERPLPDIQVVDLKKAREQRGIQRFITPELHSAMKETLARGEQTLLFLNRRGFANFPVCKTCGDPISCKHCDISMTLHHKTQAYNCHFCGFSRPASSICPTCGSSNIHLLGMGTEKVELAAQRLFPEAKVARMDRDTTVRKGAMLKLLKELKDSKIDILVGTQMIAKGHDFPNITLVGIICADLSLSFPDFRAGEHTFQLLAQVSGRAGRGEQPGRVILQTYNPNHFSILCAKNQDYDAFYGHEINFRKALNYPPYSRLIHLRISGKDRGETRGIAQQVGAHCHELKTSKIEAFRAIEVLGPIESPLPRVAGYYRWQLLLKGIGVGSLHRFVRELLTNNRSLFSNRRVKIVVDVDPIYML